MEQIKIESLTNGPKHHLFGFHDLLITNGSGDKYLSLEVDIINRPPLPGELFGVGYVKNGQYIRIGDTTALNYPQGARQQWLGDTELFTVNNSVGDVWGTDLYDTSTNQLVDRFEATTHMLSKDGRYAYGLDYARLFRLGGYGYSGIEDKGKNEATPFNSGITKLNLETKTVELLVSVRQVAEYGSSLILGVSHHYITHLCLNPSCTRVAFLHRYFMADGGLMTRLMTIGTDGTGLRCLAQGFLSHYDWKDDKTIYIFGRANNSLDALRNNPLLSNPLMVGPMKVAKKVAKFILHRGNGGGKANVGKSFMMVTDTEQPIITPFAQEVITEDGHPMTNPINDDWCINDTYPNKDGIRTLMLYNFVTNQRVDLGTFKRLMDKPDMTLAEKYFTGVDSKILSSISQEELAFTRSGLHCDLHPRWSRNGQQAVFDSIHEGTRQIYVAYVGELQN
ncbi:hypothetical protein [Bacteroides sp.]|uniref:Uncharacterized protein n=1 Tax=Bacteroides ovatus TaxID=28116 RepID=A0A414X4Y8_BACOV|nr:hypothetical protein DW206_09435 [Bacteroides ovatus]